MRYVAAFVVACIILPPLFFAAVFYQMHEAWKDTEKFMWE